MRAKVRAAGITSNEKKRTGVVATRIGGLTVAVGVATLAGAFFAGPVAAEEGDPPPSDGPCDIVPLPPICESPDPPQPSDSDEPEPPEPSDDPTSPDPKPSNIHTKPGGGGGGGGGGNNPGGGGNNGGGGYEDSGPSLPDTGVEVGLIAGTGAALVGGGAAMILLARRRTVSVTGDDES